MKTTLLLTRHGETEWNVEGKLQGHQDSSLTLLGKRQAKWLRESLKDTRLDAIYSSTSKRAYHTAEIIRGQRQLDIFSCDSLKEIDLGSWEGQTRVDVEKKFPCEHMAFWNTPHLYNPGNDGESFTQLQDRILPKIKEIVSKHSGGSILIVTHAIALKVIMAYFREDPLEHLWHPPIIQPTALNKITIAANTANIELHGDVSHYQTVRKAVGAIAYRNNHFVLVHKVLNTFGEDPGVWDFPKGGVEEEDLSPEAAVLRELNEETGTDKYIIKQELPEKMTFNFDESIKKKIGYERQETTMFLAEFIGTKDDLKPCGREVDEIKLVESSDLLNKLTHKETAEYFERFWRRDTLQNIQAVFVDRDGTIGGTGRFIHPRDFELFPSSLEALQLLKNNGIKVIALTNQHNIAKGLATEIDFFKQFESYGFDAAYICPHEPEEGCDCHKPRPGMLLKAAAEHGLDLTQCVVIGDVGSTDMLAAAAVGAKRILVETGWGKSSLENYRHKWYEQATPDYIAKDLLDAVRWLVGSGSNI